jgi:asparagine synthase (glutamine-hydrolysing)
MCGIAGFIANKAQRRSVDQTEEIARAMDFSLAHRGPDDHDIWIDPEAGVSLVHRRLSIVDLSAAGHQSMHSADGRFVISYNGEVYSHAEIRAEIEASGHNFRGHSDTEVLLESIARVGIRATIDRLIGMFALAVWDRKTFRRWGSGFRSRNGCAAPYATGRRRCLRRSGSPKPDSSMRP